MKRLFVVGACLTIAILAIGSVSLASSASGRMVGEERLQFLDVRNQVEFLDLGRQARSEFDPSPGDTFFFSNTLRNLGDTKTLGRFVSKCTALIGTEFKCAGTLLLRRGTVELATTADFASDAPIVAAVVGGTGRYDDVGGEATITPTGVEGRSRLTLELEELD